MVPAAQVQLTAAVSTPVKPVVERTVQKGKRLGNSQKYQVGVLWHIELNQAKSHLSQRQQPARLLVEKSRRGGEVNDPLKAEARVT